MKSYYFSVAQEVTSRPGPFSRFTRSFGKFVMSLIGVIFQGVEEQKTWLNANFSYQALFSVLKLGEAPLPASPLSPRNQLAKLLKF